MPQKMQGNNAKKIGNKGEKISGEQK